MISAASFDVLQRNLLLELQHIWCFNNRCGHATYQMEIDMAVEEPNARVISPEADQYPAVCWYVEDVASCRVLMERVLVSIPAA